MKVLAISLLAAALCLASLTTAAAQSITTFSVSGSTNTIPTSINQLGTVAGVYSLADGTEHGFLRSNKGAISTFSAFGTQSKITYPFAVNDSGATAGVFYLTNSSNQGTTFGFYRSPGGAITRITGGSAANAVTFPVTINNAGQVAGFYTNAAQQGGFLWQNGVFTSFAAPNSLQTNPSSINASGEITGTYNDKNDVLHGFLRGAAGNFTTFDPPGSTQTWPHSINSLGQISGWYVDQANNEVLFIRQVDGSFTVFTPPGDFFFGNAGAPSINDAGVVAGTGAPFNGSPLTHAYLRLTNGALEEFQVSGDYTEVIDINNAGEVAGYYQSNGAYTGFVSK